MVIAAGSVHKLRGSGERPGLHRMGVMSAGCLQVVFGNREGNNCGWCGCCSTSSISAHTTKASDVLLHQLSNWRRLGRQKWVEQLHTFISARGCAAAAASIGCPLCLSAVCCPAMMCLVLCFVCRFDAPVGCWFLGVCCWVRRPTMQHAACQMVLPAHYSSHWCSACVVRSRVALLLVVLPLVADPQ